MGTVSCVALAWIPPVKTMKLEPDHATAEVAVFVTTQVELVTFSGESSPMKPSVVMLPVRVCPFCKATLLVIV